MTSQISKKKPTAKGWIILLICLVVLAGTSFTLYWFNRPLVSLYYYDLVKNPFQPGNNMYIKEWLVDKSSAKDGFNVNLYRWARPLTDDEVDELNINLTDKALIKKDLSSKKPYMAECGWAIKTDVLCKLKSAYISKYSESKIANLYFGDGNYFPSLFFAIHPIQQAIFRESFTEAPSGYKFDDNFPFYLMAHDLSLKESKSFRDVK